MTSSVTYIQNNQTGKFYGECGTTLNTVLVVIQNKQFNESLEISLLTTALTSISCSHNYGIKLWDSMHILFFKNHILGATEIDFYTALNLATPAGNQRTVNIKQ